MNKEKIDWEIIRDLRAANGSENLKLPKDPIFSYDSR